jgi:putative acetyltransferase
VDPRAGVIATHRRATRADAPQLFERRRKSIIALAPRGMPASEVASWAADLTIAGMEAKIREMEVWAAEIDGRVVGWGAIRDDRLEGLYTDPEFAGQGIGATLLSKLETLLHRRGIRTIRADASANAEGFYLGRGYEPEGTRQGGARPVIKRLPPPPR